jgi:hypothetical protein
MSSLVLYSAVTEEVAEADRMEGTCEGERDKGRVGPPFLRTLEGGQDSNLAHESAMRGLRGSLNEKFSVVLFHG